MASFNWNWSYRVCAPQEQKRSYTFERIDLEQVTTMFAMCLPMNLPLSWRQSERFHWHEDLFDGWTQHSVEIEILISHRMRWEPILRVHSIFLNRCSTSLSVYEIFSSCVAVVPGSIKSQWHNVRVLPNPWRSFLAKCFCGPDRHIHSLDVKNVFFSTEHPLKIEEAIQTILVSKISTTVLKLSCRRVHRENQRCLKSWVVEYNFPLRHACDTCQFSQKKGERMHEKIFFYDQHAPVRHFMHTTVFLNRSVQNSI